jgi:hypothetical protein
MESAIQSRRQGAPNGSSESLPFVTGNLENSDLYFELVIDRSGLPSTIELLLDVTPAKVLFPALGGSAIYRSKRFATTFLDRARITAQVCDCEGVLTLEAGSTFVCHAVGTEGISLKGAEFVTRGGAQFVVVRARQAVIEVQKSPGELCQMNLGGGKDSSKLHTDR